MPDASPIRWHLAHTTWFFETFLLEPHQPLYKPFHPQFGFLFNSYYDSLGSRWPRAERGLMVRPTVAEVFRYRAHVDEHMDQFLSDRRAQDHPRLSANLLLGLHHEQQHQELMVTDLKHAWAANPLQPVYRSARMKSGVTPPLRWQEYSGGLVRLGHDEAGFAFDNESPRHQAFLQPFRLANRLVTNGEYRDFIEDGGYDRPELWLSDGWATRQSQDWIHPLYWSREDNEWSVTTLVGRQPVDPDEPVCHVSYYEADAFARWAKARLPSEGEWETAAADVAVAGHFLEGGGFHPAPGCADDDRGPLFQMFGDVWQWTASPYVAYPGYHPAEGALGEYNGKFMCNQFVLRGASCATPRSHARRTYRNFFPPDARWQFTGIRLAKELS
jgi:ergothioneine biosynthesis protein EgtB